MVLITYDVNTESKYNDIIREINKLPSSRWKTLLLMPLFPLLYPALTFNTFKTLGSFLDEIIEDEELKLILQANLQYYHDDPYTMSLIYFSAAQGSYYKGGYFIKGGSQKLSDYLATIIIDHKVITVIFDIILLYILVQTATVNSENCSLPVPWERRR